MSSLPKNRTYRAVCINEHDGVQLECSPHDNYKSAHMETLGWDSLYNYPDQLYWVERSIDGGATWQEYDASEYIDGRPAWTHSNL